ncbi:YchJ family metal-binding protein [Saxibacter everestensis]|uniref:YchJ family metal-binding protein n=1 Tax=Saxibacter everestensis TaxID=2909229 RepID=A0ABY8QXX6_9MICO|nr:YchJ family metal-binding protein [Brevibacteriaceae bacterium ZFBP1038]
MTCPCGGLPAGASFAECCQPAMDLTSWPTSAEALMRSRYTAFVRRDADHLFRTWHPRTRPAEVDASRGTVWLGLEILQVIGGTADDEVGEVHFRARFRDDNGEQVIEERSRFRKRAGRWFYLDAATDADGGMMGP